LLIAVPLPQLKHPSNPLQSEILSRSWAFLLLALFVNALGIQGLHHHHAPDQFTAYHSKVEKQFGATQVHSAKFACELCEVIKHQSQFYDLPVPVGSLLVLEDSGELTFGYLPQHPVAYILAAANKGPPSLIS
jgi:hypothetical protein